MFYKQAKALVNATYFKRYFLHYTGIKGADEDELREIASTPHSKHAYSVQDFDLIKTVQQQLIREVCSGVEDQLSSLASGEEGMTQLQLCNKYMKIKLKKPACLEIAIYVLSHEATHLHISRYLVLRFGSAHSC